MIDVNRTHLPPKEKYLQYLDSIWASHWLTNKGPLLLELEKALSDYLKADYVQLIFLCGYNGSLAVGILHPGFLRY
jgi:dTDP-4-amino-4,6-dideoxygalactose transaminase